MFNIAFFILLLTDTALTQAELPVYKCKNGNIQSIPCPNGLPNRTTKANISSQALNQFNDKIRVSNIVFTRTSESKGMWTGNILGKGNGFLILKIYNKNKLLDRKTISHYDLKNSKKPISFTFYSDIPEGEDIHWEIELE